MITYRRAVTSDKQAVAGLICELCAVLPEPYSVQDIYLSTEEYFDNPAHQCFVAEYQGEVIGILGFFITPELRKRDSYTAHEAYWYCRPEHKAGLGLIKYVERNLKVCKIEFGIAEPRLQQLLTLLKYKPIKTIMRKELLCAVAVD